MNFIVGYDTDIGLKKNINQDSLLVKTAKSPYGRIGLFIVCDGMGGLALGEVASATVIRELDTWFNEEVKNIDFNNSDENYIYKVLSEKLIYLNNKILVFGSSKGKMLGTTITLCLFVEYKYYIIQVGDSRAYKISDNLERLTKDQTFVQRELDNGNLTLEEAKNHPKRNVLLQCIGAKDDIDLVMTTGEAKSNDKFLICSDGFYKKLSDIEILNEVNSGRIINSNDITYKLKNIVQMVKERGERDNITVMLIKIID